jgi:UDP-N-acetylmuramoylalanine--D-glutamate ligase
MKKYTILGLARSGIAAAYKLKELGYSPFLSEYQSADKVKNSAQLIKDFECEFSGHTELALDCDIMVVSPGIPNIPILQEAEKKGIELISEIELGFRLKEINSKIIAVTGSNGKSTTVSLIAHILEVSGKKTVLAGNIGTAFTANPIEKSGIDFIVLELSSFQLEKIVNFQPNVAMILNITPDHLNRYDNFEQYAETKFNIFKNLKKNNFAIFNADDSVIENFSEKINGTKLSFSMNKKNDIYYQDGIIYHNNNHYFTADCSIKGPHNIANCMAAILAVSPFDIDPDKIRLALKTFKSLPHRLEFVRQINGINFINDSKATNTDSVKYAIQSFEKPIRLIMGGRGKGEDYSILQKHISKNVAKLYLIGETIPEMKKAFSKTCEILECSGFEEAIKMAYKEAQKGESVVLSPACTSYDMFENFEKRGEKFKEIVEGLT